MLPVPDAEYQHFPKPITGLGGPRKEKGIRNGVVGIAQAGRTSRLEGVNPHPFAGGEPPSLQNAAYATVHLRELAVTHSCQLT